MNFICKESFLSFYSVKSSRGQEMLILRFPSLLFTELSDLYFDLAQCRAESKHHMTVRL